MLQPLKRLGVAIADIDRSALKAIIVSILAFGGLGAILTVVGVAGVGNPERIGHLLEIAGGLGLWGLPLTVGFFAVFALIGVPQIALVSATVVAFGPVEGFVYSWVGNLVACILGFLIGKRVGAEALRAHSGPAISRFLDRIGENGFLTCLLIRLVPTVPFTVVNMAAGVAGIRLRDFILGTAIGSVPKIGLTVFAGHSIVQAVKGGGVMNYVYLALTVAAWIAMGFIVKRWMAPREAAS